MPSHAAVVTEIEELAPSVLQITIAFSDDTFRFQPGQWVNFRFPEGVSRAYTIASAPERPQAVQLCVRLGPGKGGIALKKLEAGATVTVEGPYGDFLLPEGDKRPVVFLAGTPASRRSAASSCTCSPSTTRGRSPSCTSPTSGTSSTPATSIRSRATAASSTRAGRSRPSSRAT